MPAGRSAPTSSLKAAWKLCDAARKVATHEGAVGLRATLALENP
jgi:hypothetical protein